MDICIFAKYKVKITDEYDYISDYEIEPTYDHDKCVCEKEMDGYELIDLVKKNLQDFSLIDIKSENNLIHFTFFNPNQGTGSDVFIEYTPSGIVDGVEMSIDSTV